MKKDHGILWVLLISVIFIFLLIYKKSWITRLLYEQQARIDSKAELTRSCASLEMRRYQLQDAHSIYRYAHENLHFAPIAITRVKSIKRESALGKTS